MVQIAKFLSKLLKKSALGAKAALKLSYQFKAVKDIPTDQELVNSVLRGAKRTKLLVKRSKVVNLEIVEKLVQYAETSSLKHKAITGLMMTIAFLGAM